MNQTIQQMLEEARRAYHALQTGRMTVKVRRGDKEVEYNRTNINQLQAYITELESQLGISSRTRRGPAGVRF